MTKRRLSFREEFQKELKEVSNGIKKYDKRLAELHPAWCEYMRVKKRKERLERKRRQLPSTIDSNIYQKSKHI